MLDRFHGFLVRNNASIWIAFGTVIPAATMMHPTFASLVAILFVLGGVFTVRFVAHLEARGDGYEAGRTKGFSEGFAAAKDMGIAGTSPNAPAAPPGHV